MRRFLVFLMLLGCGTEPKPIASPTTVQQPIIQPAAEAIDLSQAYEELQSSNESKEIVAKTYPGCTVEWATSSEFGWSNLTVSATGKSSQALVFAFACRSCDFTRHFLPIVQDLEKEWQNSSKTDFVEKDSDDWVFSIIGNRPGDPEFIRLAFKRLK